MEERIKEILDNLVHSQLLDCIGDILISLCFVVMVIYLLWLSKYVKENTQKGENKDVDSEK